MAPQRNTPASDGETDREFWMEDVEFRVDEEVDLRSKSLRNLLGEENRRDESETDEELDATASVEASERTKEANWNW